MKRFLLVIVAVFATAVISMPLSAQVDELSAATGYPIAMGAPAIWGQVSIEGMPRGERKPNIFVALLYNGTQTDRRQTSDNGYFVFQQTPRHGHALLFEIDSAEIGRSYLTVGTGNRIRQDVSVNWMALKGNTPTKTGTVSANAYNRDSDAEKAFDKGMAAIKDNKNDVAITVFTEMLKKDAKDYLVWTMLGSIYSSDKKYGEANNAFSKALEQRPDFTLARVNLGKMELNQKNIDKAIEILAKAVELDPKSADANHQLGEAYLQAKKGSLAVGFLNKAIELAPVQKAEIHLRLAALYNGANMKDRTAAEYKMFLDKTPNYADKAKLEQYIKDNPPK